MDENLAKVLTNIDLFDLLTGFRTASRGLQNNITPFIMRNQYLLCKIWMILVGTHAVCKELAQRAETAGASGCGANMGEKN